MKRALNDGAEFCFALLACSCSRLETSCLPLLTENHVSHIHLSHRDIDWISEAVNGFCMKAAAVRVHASLDELAIFRVVAVTSIDAESESEGD